MTLFFFFQAEDGIRDVAVTGVQTCALPIFSGGAMSELLTNSAHNRFEPTASICEMTNFWLVSATVTTSTMEALPIITPSDVRSERTLFARSASIATDIDWRISIVAF